MITAQHLIGEGGAADEARRLEAYPKAVLAAYIAATCSDLFPVRWGYLNALLGGHAAAALKVLDAECRELEKRMVKRGIAVRSKDGRVQFEIRRADNKRDVAVWKVYLRTSKDFGRVLKRLRRLNEGLR